jgi:hypothetical protein
MQSFRRGIDRRAYVLARAQCGDAALVHQALIGVDHAFKQEAGALPIAQWPIRFWTLLLSRKELTQGESPWQALSAIGRGSRAALLLRLVGGLDFSHAAQVLGISEETYRFALQRGLEQLQAAGYSMAELEQLRDAFFDEVKQLSADELSATLQQASAEQDMPQDVGIDGTQEDAVAELVFSKPLSAPKNNRSRWWLYVVIAAVIFLLAAAAYFWDQKNRQEQARAAQIRATEQDRVAGDLLMHADYDVIAAGDALDSVQEANFYSWLAADAPPEDVLGLEQNPTKTLPIQNALAPENISNSEPSDD